MKGNLIALFISLLLSLTAAEGVLRVFTYHPISFSSNRVPDEFLRYRLSSDLEDIDARGFRNASEDSHYDVAAIGDSHTFGDNVDSRRTWPQQFAAQEQKAVYNFGVGSYNIFQYFYLLDEAIERGVDGVIIALYPANDFFDGVCDILALEYWRDYLREHDLDKPGCEGLTSYGTKRKVIATLLEHSAMFSLLYHNFLKTRVIAKQPYQVENYRLSRELIEIHRKNTDIQNVVVAGAVENFELMLHGLARKAATRGVRLFFVIIPSKQRVLANWAVRSSQTLPVEITSAVDQEEELADLIINIIEKDNVPVIDATELTVDALGEQRLVGRKIYPEDSGHPNEYGYAAYAKAAAQVFSSRASSTVPEADVKAGADGLR